VIARARFPSWMRRALVLAAVFAVLQMPADAAREDALAVDLSEDLVGISTGFTGADVLLFGATEGVGDVIVVVRSPSSSVVVRRKERIAGVWVNAHGLVFNDAPGFYHVAASKPLDALLSEAARAAHQIGVDNIAFRPHEFVSAEDENAFREALVRNKQRSGLYTTAPGTVSFLGSRLFRTRVALPANVPTGNYDVTVLLVADGEIIERSSSVLDVRKVGLEAKITEFAFQQAPLYGAIAVVIALIAGWFAGFVFRKV
jgi:uncharacterized protein (TIGR02186 family)